MDHRIVSQSGPIEVRFSPDGLGKLRLALFTECGAVRLPRGNGGLESRMFHGSMGDMTSRSWHGFFTGEGDDRLGDLSVPCSSASPPPCGAIAAAQGIDIISRAGTVTYEPIAGAAAGR